MKGVGTGPPAFPDPDHDEALTWTDLVDEGIANHEAAWLKYQLRRIVADHLIHHGRTIDYDLKITGYQDISEYTRDEMKRLFEKQLARAEAKAVKSKR